MGFPTTICTSLLSLGVELECLAGKVKWAWYCWTLVITAFEPTIQKSRDVTEEDILFHRILASDSETMFTIAEC